MSLICLEHAVQKELGVPFPSSILITKYLLESETGSTAPGVTGQVAKSSPVFGSSNKIIHCSLILLTVNFPDQIKLVISQSAALKLILTNC